MISSITLSASLALLPAKHVVRSESSFFNNRASTLHWEKEGASLQSFYTPHLIQEIGRSREYEMRRFGRALARDSEVRASWLTDVRRPGLRESEDASPIEQLPP